MATRTRQDWKLDDQGEYPRRIGWKHTKSNKLDQHKFRLGADLKEAKRREQKLLEFWERIEATCDRPPAVWTDFTLGIAKQLAKGQRQIGIPRKPLDSPEAYARYVHRVQKHYPMISFVAEDEEAYVDGATTNRARVHEQIDGLRTQIDGIETLHLRTGNISEFDLTPSDGTLHEAMRAYIAWVEKDYFRPELGRITANGRTKIRQVETLMTRHADVSLTRLDEDAVEEMFRFWRQRPLKLGSDKPITKKSAENYISELMRFLKWLHKSKQFDWRKPENFEEIKRRVDPTPHEQQKRLVQVDTFSRDELILLNKYATPLERVFLLLGINCGFGTAEVASLLIGEVILFQAHEARHQEILHYTTTNADSFIKRIRRKNGVYGEHILFPQTVEAMQWALNRRNKQPKPISDAPLLLNEKDAQPYDRPTEGGNRNQGIPNRFADLIRRIKIDHQDFRPLSFGKLRKTAGDLIRRLSDGEIFGVFMCHGQPVATDDLADVYSNRPFGKVFDAIKKVQEFLQPVFEAAGPSPFKPPLRAYTSRKTSDRMIELHDAGKSIREIADAVKKSRTTVHRHLSHVLADRDGGNGSRQPASSSPPDSGGQGSAGAV